MRRFEGRDSFLSRENHGHESLEKRESNNCKQENAEVGVQSMKVRVGSREDGAVQRDCFPRVQWDSFPERTGRRGELSTVPFCGFSAAGGLIFGLFNTLIIPTELGAGACHSCSPRNPLHFPSAHLDHHCSFWSF